MEKVPAELYEKYAATHDVALRNEIVEKNLYIAQILAKKMVGRGVEYDDLLQVASVALIKAVERFDPSKGLQFSTFATPSILGELKNYFRDKSRTIRLGRKNGAKILQVRKAAAELTGQLFRAPTVPEIAERTGLTEEEVMEAMEYTSGTVSLDSTIEDSETSLYEVIPDHDNPFERLEDRSDLRQALGRLNEQEKVFIRRRFAEGRSQADIAKEMGVSQMYVSRMEKKVLEKLRNDMTHA